MLAFPHHGASKLEDGVHALKQSAIPMLFQSPPTAFNGSVFAVIGRIIRQCQGDTCLVNTLHQTRQKLGAATMALVSVVEIENQRLDLGEPLFVSFPPLVENIPQTLVENIPQTIACHFGGHRLHCQFVVLRQEDTHRRHHCRRMKVMGGGMDFHSVFTAPRRGADFDTGFSVDREPQNRRVGICLRVDLAQLVKERVGCGNLFWGRLFCTVFGG